MAEKFSRWDPVDDLTTEEDITLYFQACIEDDPGDGSLVRAALNWTALNWAALNWAAVRWTALRLAGLGGKRSVRRHAPG